ncbi:MAG: hypothetical protein APF77_13050 [Clostridia bacterium BRH_c25]|nr:MAG: hypothetical protein APF77_13050 [Clostridia bacterium BRH_c25]
MSISSISEIYNRIYAYAVSKASNSDNATNITDSTETNNLTDILELGSSEVDLSAYLNYNSSGNYNSSSSLLDYLTAEDHETDSLIGALYSEGSDNSDSGIFDSLIEAKSKEINNLISKAMGKMGSVKTVTSEDNVNNEE